MTTKAGKIQFKDVKQGKTFWHVRAKVTPDGPSILAIEQLSCLGIPFKSFITKSYFIWKLPVKVVKNNGRLLKECRVYELNLSALLKCNGMINPGFTKDYEHVFSSYKAANKFAENHMRREVMEEDIRRYNYREAMMSDGLDDK